MTSIITTESPRRIIVGLIGDNRVGKDTFAIELAKLTDYKMTAFADPVKDVLRVMFNFSEDQLYGNSKEIIDPRWNITPREAMTKLGTELMQFDIYKYLPNLITTIPQRTFWANRIIQQINAANLETVTNYIITDIRFLHELNTVKKYCDDNDVKLYIVKIVRPNNPHITQINSEHLSRAEINMIPAEFITHTIYNDSTMDEFMGKVKAFSVEISGK